MDKIDYDIPLIKQGLQDCVQTNTAQILNYYGLNKTIEDVKKEVPVYVTKEGKPIGSSLGHIATYFINQGFDTTIHTVDIQIFDRSWLNLSNQDLIANLQKRRPFLKHPNYETEALDLVFDGYVKFFQAGGKISFPVIDESYLIKLLKLGPIFAVVSFNFLNSTSKYKFSDDNQDTVPDSIQGSPGTHVVTIAGFRENKFKLIDPDPTFGGVRWVDSSLLIGSIYLAETDYDSLLITIKKSS